MLLTLINTIPGKVLRSPSALQYNRAFGSNYFRKKQTSGTFLTKETSQEVT